MSQLIESICYGVGVVLLTHAIWMNLRDRRRGRAASENPNPAPPGPTPASQIKPPQPPAPPPPQSTLMAPGSATFTAPAPARLPRSCVTCGAPATHLTVIDLAGAADQGKATLTVCRPLCPTHAAQLAGVAVLELMTSESWNSLASDYARNGWGSLDARGSKLYGVPIDETSFAERFEPAPVKGGR